MPNIMKRVPTSYKPKGNAPIEHPAFITDEEAHILKMLGGLGMNTKYGIPSFTDPSQARGNSLSSRSTTTTSSPTRTTTGQGTKARPTSGITNARSTGQGSQSSAPIRVTSSAPRVSTGQGRPPNAAAANAAMIASRNATQYGMAGGRGVVPYGNNSPNARQGSQAATQLAQSRNAFQYGVQGGRGTVAYGNNSPIRTSQGPDWIIGSRSSVPKMQDRILPSTGKDQSRIPASIPQTLINNYAAYQQPPNNRSLAPVQTAMQQPKLNYLTGGYEPPDTSYLYNPVQTPVQHGKSGGLGMVAFGQGQIKGQNITRALANNGMTGGSWGSPNAMADSGDYPAGYNPNGPETPSNGIDAMPARINPARDNMSASLYGDAPIAAPKMRPQPAYFAGNPLATQGSNSLYGDNVQPESYLGRIRRAMPAINDKVSGLISPLTSMFGTGEGFPNYGGSTGGQGTPNTRYGVSNKRRQINPSDGQTFSSQAEYTTLMKKFGISDAEIAKGWAAYVKAHPSAASSATGSSTLPQSNQIPWYYPQYTQTWAGLPTGRGNG